MRNGALWANSRHWLNLRPVYALGRFILENFPLWVGYGVTRGVTEVAYRVGFDLTSTLDRNVRQVLSAVRPELTGRERDRTVASLVHRIFVNRGRWFADLSCLAGCRRFEDLVHFRMEGAWDSFRGVLAAGRGALMVSAHVGNWPGGGVAFARMGIPVRPVMYLNHAGDEMDRGVVRHGGTDPIYIDGDPFTMMEIVRTLHRGEVVAMMGDKPWDARWIEIPFFGRPARFPLGPARIARLARTPMVPSFCVPSGPRRYVATIMDPIEVSGGDPEAAERDAMTAFARVAESVIARNLEVWFGAFNPVWDRP